MISEVHFKDAHPCNAPPICVIWTRCVKVTNAARVTNILLQAPLSPPVHHAVGPEVRDCSLTCCAHVQALRWCSNHPSCCRSRECPLCFRHLQLEVSISLSDTLHALVELEACRVEAPEEMCHVARAGDTVLGTPRVMKNIASTADRQLGRPVPFRTKPAAFPGH